MSGGRAWALVWGGCNREATGGASLVLPCVKWPCIEQRIAGHIVSIASPEMQYNHGLDGSLCFTCNGV